MTAARSNASATIAGVPWAAAASSVSAPIVAVAPRLRARNESLGLDGGGAIAKRLGLVLHGSVSADPVAALHVLNPSSFGSPPHRSPEVNPIAAELVGRLLVELKLADVVHQVADRHRGRAGDRHAGDAHLLARSKRGAPPASRARWGQAQSPRGHDLSVVTMLVPTTRKLHRTRQQVVSFHRDTITETGRRACETHGGKHRQPGCVHGFIETSQAVGRSRPRAD
jgi:hypothetical protein